MIQYLNRNLNESQKPTTFVSNQPTSKNYASKYSSYGQTGQTGQMQTNEYRNENVRT